MPQAIESYVPQTAVEKRRRRAVLVWSGFTFLTTFWLFLIVAAPVAEANNFTGVSQPIYKFCSYICHQITARSYFLEKEPLAVCARCFGLYAGLLGGSILYPFLRGLDETRPLAYFWFFLAMIPMAVDWSLGFLGIWENTHFSRLLSGLILGAACAVFIIPALVEISRFSDGYRK